MSSEEVEQELVINVEAKLLQGRVKVGPVNKNGNSIFQVPAPRRAFATWGSYEKQMWVGLRLPN